MKKIILAALLVSGIAGLGTNAHAVPLVYANSNNHVYGGFVAFSDPGNVTNVPLQSNNTSAANASLTPVNGNGVSDQEVGLGLQDVDVQIDPDSTFGVAAAPTNNSAFNPYLTLVGKNGNYSVADSEIRSVQDITPPGQIEAFTYAEGNLTKVGSADSGARNSSVTGFTYVFDLADTNTLTLSFFANPIMNVFVENDPLIAAGTKAESVMNFNVTLRKTSGAGAGTMFSWSPDGANNNTLGLTAELDPNSLNASLFALNAGNDFSYTPGPGFYSITSGVLSSGGYQLQLTNSNEQALVLAVVPEPGTIVLLGLGLVGLAGMSYRRKKS